jgi:hypothetical protein
MTHVEPFHSRPRLPGTWYTWAFHRIFQLKKSITIHVVSVSRAIKNLNLLASYWIIVRESWRQTATRSKLLFCLIKNVRSIRTVWRCTALPVHLESLDHHYSIVIVTTRGRRPWPWAWLETLVTWDGTFEALTFTRYTTSNTTYSASARRVRPAAQLGRYLNC